MVRLAGKTAADSAAGHGPIDTFLESFLAPAAPAGS